MRTFLELQVEVRTSAKLVGTDATVTQVIKDSINAGFLEEVKSSPTAEFLVVGAGVDLSSVPYILPSDFMVVDEVRFQYDGTVWELADYTIPIPPAPIFGKPRAYKLSKGTPTNIALFPPLDPAGPDDALEIDYYALPARLVNDGDVLPSNLIEERVVRRAEALMALYSTNPAKAQQYMAPLLQQMQQP